MDARRLLLERLIDHAPLYPPASLPPPDAIADHEAARRSPSSWVLARLVWPATGIAGLVELLETSGDGPLPVSLLLDGAPPAAVGDRIDVEQAELRAPSDPAELVDVMRTETARLRVPCYAEVPIGDAATELVDALARVDGPARAGAKVRCGGDVVPTAKELAAFVCACVRSGVAFKATAGLHHPFASAGAHGFLNLAVATALAAEHGLDEGGVADVLADRDRSHFTVGLDAVGWRDLTVDAEGVARARRELFVSIGSCSFTEPVDDLDAAGLLPT
jgi:hypothetical protein